MEALVKLDADNIHPDEKTDKPFKAQILSHEEAKRLQEEVRLKYQKTFELLKDL